MLRSSKRLTYKRVGALDLLADVYPAYASGEQPVILMLHAGALIAGGRGWFPRYQVEALRRAGYCVVAIDYRLAPETSGELLWEDVVDAIAWIRTKLNGSVQVDPQRLAVLGHSAGGYLTLRCGYDIDPPPRALVSFYGYGDLFGHWYARPDPFYGGFPAVSDHAARRVVGNTPIADASLALHRMKFYFYCRQQGCWVREVFGITDPTDEERRNALCPERNVHGAYPPTLLLHGDADSDVPHEMSRRMAEALRIEHVEHHLITIPGGDHSFDVPGSFRPAPGRVFDAAALATRLVAPWIGVRLLPGLAPRRSERYMRPLLSFLARHLDAATR